MAAFAGTLGPQNCKQRLSSQWLQGESAKWPSHSRNNSRLKNAVRIQGSSPCLGIDWHSAHSLSIPKLQSCHHLDPGLLDCPSQATGKGLRINKDKRQWKNGRGKNGCGPKIEPVEPASEPFLSHLLYNHVILKNQPGYTLKKQTILGCICWYSWTPKLQTATI